MAAKLLIIKQTRPNVETQFFAQTQESKDAIAAAPSTGVAIGERNIGDLLIKIRTLFFPSANSYTTWLTVQSVIAMMATRDAYNAANGITLVSTLIDLPTYDPYTA